jgi:hypothetical protein
VRCDICLLLAQSRHPDEGNQRSNKNRKISDRGHSPINETVVDFAYENWRRVMLVTLPPLKIQLRVGRPRKVAVKTVGKLEGSLTTSGASLVYAGYPYDPYA